MLGATRTWCPGYSTTWTKYWPSAHNHRRANSTTSAHDHASSTDHNNSYANNDKEGVVDCATSLHNSLVVARVHLGYNKGPVPVVVG